MQKVEKALNEEAELAKRIFKKSVKSAPLFLLGAIVKITRRQIKGKEIAKLKRAKIRWF